MKLALKKLLTKALIAIIALQIINLSIDAVDFQPIVSTISIADFNYLNSMTEYISEIILGKKDAFPEYQKESSSAKTQIIKHNSLKIFEHSFDGLIANFPVDTFCFLIPVKERYANFYFNEVNQPPPKFS